MRIQWWHSARALVSGLQKSSYSVVVPPFGDGASARLMYAMGFSKANDTFRWHV